MDVPATSLRKCPSVSSATFQSCTWLSDLLLVYKSNSWDEASDSQLTVLVSEVGHAWPGVEGHWDLPTAGTPALSGWDSDCRQDGAAMAPTHRSGETSWWVDPALILLPECQGVKSSTCPAPCLGFCSLPLQEEPPQHNPPVCYPPTSFPALRDTVRGWGGYPSIVPGQRQTLPNTAGGLLQKAVGTPALIKVGRCINCWIHQFVKLNTWKLEADNLWSF